MVLWPLQSLTLFGKALELRTRFQHGVEAVLTGDGRFSRRRESGDVQ